MAKPVILCVDDEKIILSSLKEQLKRTFASEYSIETAESGEEALEILADLKENSTGIPVIISDYIMPGIKGDELLIKVHAENPGTLKILLTGQADTEAIGNAVNHAKLYRYISKPWEQADLEMTVTEAIRSYFQAIKLEEQNQLLIKANAELEQKVKTFFKFVPAQFIEALNHSANPEDIHLGDASKKNMAVLFSDIRNFTDLSEKLSPEESFEFINRYLAYMGPVVRNNKGFIDKYIGDAIMALFESSDNAIEAASEMLKALAEFNKERISGGKREIKIGIGIHTGSLMLGTVGEQDRMQTTVIGETVNIAARTETMTKVYRTPIIITEKTKSDLNKQSAYKMRLIDRVKMRGISYDVDIFEVLQCPDKTIIEKILKSEPEFQKGRELYQKKKYKEAIVHFQACVQACSQDEVSQSYLERCKREEEYFIE